MPSMTERGELELYPPSEVAVRFVNKSERGRVGPNYQFGDEIKILANDGDVETAQANLAQAKNQMQGDSPEFSSEQWQAVLTDGISFPQLVILTARGSYLDGQKISHSVVWNALTASAEMEAKRFRQALKEKNSNVWRRAIGVGRTEQELIKGIDTLERFKVQIKECRNVGSLATMRR
jgi:hypothetical protein